MYLWGRRQRGLLLLSGFCGFIAFPLLFTFGVSLTTANHATMILAILPVTTGAIAHTWDRQKPAAAWWLGCAVAFAGVAKQLLRALGPRDALSFGGGDRDLRRALATAFVDRLAKRREDDPTRAVLGSGRGVRMGSGCDDLAFFHHDDSVGFRHRR